jgi:hypothetical protein
MGTLGSLRGLLPTRIMFLMEKSEIAEVMRVVDEIAAQVVQLRRALEAALERRDIAGQLAAASKTNR